MSLITTRYIVEVCWSDDVWVRQGPEEGYIQHALKWAESELRADPAVRGYRIVRVTRETLVTVTWDRRKK